MNQVLIDRYSFLHMLSGIVASFFMEFKTWFILHMLFEIIENTNQGVYFIQTYLLWWPGRKDKADPILNSISDQVFSLIGFLIKKGI